MIVSPIKTRLALEQESLFAFIVEHVPVLKEQAILCITSKVAALCEGRTASLDQKDEVIASEAEIVIQTKWCKLTRRKNRWCANAGVDESNANGKLILLPEDSFKTAGDLRIQLLTHFNLKELGVIITDSRTIPLLSGTIGEALGYAGFEPLHDYRKEVDLFGRPFHFSKVDIADSLAASAVLVMGEGKESIPLAVIEDAPVVFTDRVGDPDELLISPEDDIYTPLFHNTPIDTDQKS